MSQLRGSQVLWNIRYDHKWLFMCHKFVRPVAVSECHSQSLLKRWKGVSPSMSLYFNKADPFSAFSESMYKHRPPKEAPGKYLVFKRWDTLEEQDDPQVVIFFATPDVIAGLHGLANFDTMTPYSVIAPFGTACDAIVGFPLSELEAEDPKAVLGSMDPSARIYFKPNISTFAAPWPKFLSMLENMDESFLDTTGWSKVKSRFKWAIELIDEWNWCWLLRCLCVRLFWKPTG